MQIASMECFFLFFTFPKLKDLLLEELKIKHPYLKLSFSNNQFISMKGELAKQDNIQKKPLVFAKRQAIFLEKLSKKPDKNFIYLNQQYWHYKILPGSHLDFLDYQESTPPKEAPARAYLKLQQAHQAFNLNLQPNQRCIEIGSAPGGISYYLLKLGLKLTSIDPANMDNKLIRDFSDNFEHLRKSIFDIKKEDLPHHCDWVISDLNLKGELNISQSKRIISYYPNIKGAFLTIKTPDKKDLLNIEKWSKSFPSNFQTRAFHLPSHRREIGLLLINSNCS